MRGFSRFRHLGTALAALAIAWGGVRVSMARDPVRSSEADVSAQIRFGAEMAQKGNWREAIFRWKKALQSNPENARLHNNLAVAYETLGEYGLAEEAYKLALKHGPGVKEIRQNYALFRNFYDRYLSAQMEPREPAHD